MLKYLRTSPNGLWDEASVACGPMAAHSSHKAKPTTILIADDSEEDRTLAQLALQKARLPNDVHMVHTGEQLQDYLRRQGSYGLPGAAPRPGLILLDLHMPLDGLASLQRITTEPSLREIPLVVLSSSRAHADIFRSYHLGANSFLAKPPSFQDLVKAMKVLGHYWFGTVELPDHDGLV
jgi:two-component system, response regulator